MRNGINLLLICCCVATASAREEYRRDFHKSMSLADGRGFRVENSLGSVIIRAQGKGQVEVRAVIRVSAVNAAEARRYADQVQILVDESASGISVRTQYPSQLNTRNLSFGADYDIVIPETTPLEVRNRFGATTVSNLHSAAIINSSNGHVSFTGGRGRQQIENSFGNVDVRTNDGDVTVRSGNGAVTVSDVTGAVDITNRFARTRAVNVGRGLTIHGNNGDISVENVGGLTNISNSFGPVNLSDIKSDVVVQNQNGAVQAIGVTGAAELHTTFAGITFSRIGKTLTVRAANAGITGDTVGSTATVETTFGSVDLRAVKGGARVTAGNSWIKLSGIGGEAYAKTSFSPITIMDVAGAVTVEGQNASVTVDAKPAQKCQPISLRTSFAPIRVTVPNGVGYNVTAHTSFGRIHSEADLSVQGDIRADSLNGKIAGGGCELRIIGQNSGIDILKR